MLPFYLLKNDLITDRYKFIPTIHDFDFIIDKIARIKFYNISLTNEDHKQT